MREQDKKNIIRAWPVYAVLLLLLGFVVWTYWKNPPNNSGKPLSDAIAGKLDPTGLRGIIESRRGWDIAFEDSWGTLATDFSYTDVNGDTARLSDHRDKNVMLVFWATWCPPCRAEIPHLVQLRKETPADELEIIAISNEAAATVADFAAKNGINYTVVAGNIPLPEPFSRVRSIPTAFFIDTKGTIKLATVGVVPEEASKAILTAGKAS
ncbi:MAG TPA: TlpA family protein disulfide reductase [Phycisphaerales bacterium]|nr:TlpA family protein disulfide reductase [Phycisphaerales bacterium]